MAEQSFDVLVIGSGPGGYVAAIRAAQIGFKTAIVEREHLGGICLNWGCIPTKALLRSADVYSTVMHAKSFGVTVEGKVGFDAAAIVQRSRGVSGQLNGGVGFLLKKNKVDVIWGEARIARPGTDVTLVSFSIGMTYALGAAEELAWEGIEAEVIDLRTLRPMDSATVIESVKKTGRCVAIEEGWSQSGVGAEIAARVQSEAFDWLDAPVARVTGKDVPMPYAANLEKLALPSVAEVIAAAKAVLYRS